MQVGCCRSQVCSCKSSRTSVSNLAGITLRPNSASLAIATMSVLDNGHSEKEKDIVNGSCDTHANCTMLSSTWVWYFQYFVHTPMSVTHNRAGVLGGRLSWHAPGSASHSKESAFAVELFLLSWYNCIPCLLCLGKSWGICNIFTCSLVAQVQIIYSRLSLKLRMKTNWFSWRKSINILFPLLNSLIPRN